MTVPQKESFGRWLPLALNVAAIIISLAIFSANIRNSVEGLEKATNAQGTQLTKITESLTGLQTSAAVAAANSETQNKKLIELETRIGTLEARLQSQGERLARKGI